MGRGSDVWSNFGVVGELPAPVTRQVSPVRFFGYFPVATQKDLTNSGTIAAVNASIEIGGR